MASDVGLSPIERLQDHALAVDPKSIEAEFDRIWRETEGAGIVADESSVRVRVLNLVALGTSEKAVARFEEVMRLLPERHPCRGILAATSNADAGLAAVISAHCWRSMGGRGHVCSEEVVLTGATSQQAELASAFLALLVPDLPVVVWLMDEDAERSDLAERALDVADVVIVDTARARPASAGYERVLALREDYRIVCHDLAWGRLSAWRALTAQIFDGADGARELDQIRALMLGAERGVESSEALLFAGWFTSRVDLALADVSRDAGRLTASFYDGTREVRLRIVPEGEPGGIHEVRIETGDATFTVQRHAESGHMHVREDWDSGSTRRIVEGMQSDDASVIERALDGGTSPGPVYEQSVRTALALCE